MWNKSVITSLALLLATLRRAPRDCVPAAATGLISSPSALIGCGWCVLRGISDG
jgi:hypothetical protein